MTQADITIALIPARGGSKGVPKKNLSILNGRPLISYSIESALKSDLIDRVIVSSDDPDILAVAQKYGAETPFVRPAELATDDSPEWLTWQHALNFLVKETPNTNIRTFVCVSPTSPLRTTGDIDKCINKLHLTNADIVISVTPSDRNPYFNMVELNPDGEAKLVVEPRQRIFRRQDAPKIYDITTVAYAARPHFILNASSIFDGKVKTVEIPSHRALDIDTELDLKFAEFLMQTAANEGDCGK